MVYRTQQKGFNIDDFDLIRVIGRGSYAKVVWWEYLQLGSKKPLGYV